MRACAHCFAAPGWLPNASPPESSAGTCDFGHGYSAQTWPTTAWVDSLVRLLDIYEIEERTGEGLEVHRLVQQDWRIFSYDEPAEVGRFLASAVQGEHPLLQAGVRARLRLSEVAGHTDHVLSWAQFSEEIRSRNRYFPQAVPDRQVLEGVLLGSLERVESDVRLYRARLVDSGEMTAADDPGAPPAQKARAGRANPEGIAYLYLAFSADTAVHEVRPTVGGRVAVGIFRLSKRLKVLNLADVEAPSFFDVDEVDSVPDQVRRILFHRYLVALGRELEKPVRSTDRTTDYIPTQYLCELAKALGLDGVLYPSSLQHGGRNLVLFDVRAAVCEAVQFAEVHALHADWVYV